MYVPAVETIVPLGSVVVAPAQIETFLLDDEFGITVKFVVAQALLFQMEL